MEQVSVIVPVYKVEKYLDRCVQSVLRQTYTELDIILVDDGSPDKCGDMCDRYAQQDSRIRVLHKENGGLSDARNEGVKLAKGKYLLFVDSDDYIREDLVEKAVGAAETKHCDIVLFDYYCVENSASEVRSTEIPPDKNICLKDFHRLLLAPPSAWTKLFDRQFYESAECCFPKGLYFEDLATTPILFHKAKSIVYLKEPLYYYMIRENSIMTGGKCDKNYRDKTKVLDSILSYYKQSGQYEMYKEELEYLVFANAYFEPSKELALAKGDKDYLVKYREYTYGRFPELKKNKYVQSLRKKDKLHLWMLDHGQYWMMRMFSNGRKLVEKMR